MKFLLNGEIRGNWCPNAVFCVVPREFPIKTRETDKMCQIDPILPKFGQFLGQNPYKTGEKKKKCQIDPVLPNFWPFLGSKTPIKLGKKRENAKSTLFYPPTRSGYRATFRTVIKTKRLGSTKGPK